MSEQPARPKLIEVALPLEAINREAAREKSIRHGHPSTLHLWWARRPLAAARAVLFAQLVDDPSAHPDRFPTEAAQRAERERLHALIERLVVWENSNDPELLAEAHREIVASTDGHPPAILDPFAGGGTIPLEAQRLGLEAHASDLNPVAVLINKALIEIPPRFAGRAPVHPGSADERMEWPGASGLAADVRAYGEWMRDEAERRIGHHYPRATLPDGTNANVIAWIWARTVTCPNPACGIEMPLVRSWWLGKKKGKEAWVQPLVVPDATHPSGHRVQFEIGHGRDGAPTAERDGTVGRSGAQCIACGGAVPLKYVREEGRAKRIGARLMAVVAEGHRRRIYLEPTEDHVRAAQVVAPVDVPEGELPTNPRDFKTPNYGMTRWAELFTNRQLLALTTFSDLVGEARERARSDALAAGLSAGDPMDDGGDGATAYADAVATYLAMALSKLADRGSTIVTWFLGRESTRNTFSRQALPMSWDFVEPNQFARGTGSWAGGLEWTVESLEGIPESSIPGIATQADAATLLASQMLLSTDPPYYDNIGYSDLSDFFYVWLRRALRDVHPELFSTLLVPKAAELVANPYRHDGKEGARQFFEEGFRAVFDRAREHARADLPITVYYAFKQSESGDDGSASTGWETLLEGMISGGWAITATWPLRSELSNRMLGQGTNALASSIVLALRPRLAGAATVDRRGFITALRAELPAALRRLQQGAIAPVDLPQAAIGPGMAVFSRYAKVLDSDGAPMSVRAALVAINDLLDEVLSEHEGDFDAATRFALAWYRQHGYATGAFGDADNLARARNTSVDAMAREGILTSAAGKVTLHRPAAPPADYRITDDERLGVWETLHHLIGVLEQDGVAAVGALLGAAEQRPQGPIDPDQVKDLTFLLFRIAEEQKRTADALSFNQVATSWPEIIAAAHSADHSGEQTTLALEED